MITIEKLTKTFGSKKALDDVSFVAEDGKVTGFLGPNGAGKSTTMRAALGLIRPDAGRALIDGRPFVKSRSPMAEVGSVLNPRSVHGGRTAYTALRYLALSNGIPKSRVDEVMAMSGITSVSKQKTGSFSLGMSQRLSISAALLGDPKNLIFDEPLNGLDPEGVMWVRRLCRYFASQGRCVLLSSHLMSEVAQVADNLVIIAQGRVIEQTSVSEFVSKYSSHAIRIITPDAHRLLPVLQAQPGVTVQILPPPAQYPLGAQVLRVLGVPLPQVAHLAASQQVTLFEISEERASLEQAYMALTHGLEEYKVAVSPGQEPGNNQMYRTQMPVNYAGAPRDAYWQQEHPNNFSNVPGQNTYDTKEGGAQ